MLNWFFGRKSSAWAIKQLDDDLLHLCGRAEATGPGSKRKHRKALAAGRYQGEIRIEDTSPELNTDLFAALIPRHELEWLDKGRVRWQGCVWRVAWVPPRCWAYRGPLTLAESPGPEGELVSTEDISAIRAKIDARNAAPSPRIWLGLEGLDNEPAPLESPTHHDQHRFAANNRDR